MESITRIAALLAFALPLFAAERVDPVNKNGKGVALKGYDAVAYFELQRPVKGAAGFSYPWMGATWWFSNPEHRDKFAADPAKYAPQYGGYCAYAVSKGHTANVNPEVWKIVNGKLYLNFAGFVQRRWEKDQEKRIADGDKNWPALHK